MVQDPLDPSIKLAVQKAIRVAEIAMISLRGEIEIGLVAAIQTAIITKAK